MTSLECYFDESGTHDGSPAVCVAGYLFNREARQKLDSEWKAALDRYELPFFRMSACAHGNPPFNRLTKNERIDIEPAVIKLINRYALLGLAIVINEAEYDHLFTRRDITGDAYSFCCWQILAGIQSWIERNQFDGEISCFFESGHKSQRLANLLMHRIFENASLRNTYRYKAHGFVEKAAVQALQAADILAWQQATQLKRWLRNDHRMRADFRALTTMPPHELFIANRKTLAGAVAYQRHLQRLPINDGVTGRLGGAWFWCPFDGEPGLLFGRVS